MINILHIETSSKNCSVSIGTDGELNALCEEFSPDFKHSENLHTFIEWVLEGAELQLNDIHAICIGSGPGSYTGLRIGAASAKGFCFGNNIPLLSVSSLYALAIPFFNSNFEYIIPVMDARRMEVYTTVYDIKGNQIENIHPHILSSISFEKYIKHKILFIGDAVEKTENFFQENNISFNADFIKDYPSAKNMTQISFEKFSKKDFEDTAYFDPLYLK